MRLSNSLIHILLGFWVAAGLFLRPPALHAAVPPLGYEIVSRSTAEYVVKGRVVSVASNPTSTEIGPYYRVSIAPPGTLASPAFFLEGLEGDSLTCRFELRNVGNAADSVMVASRLLRQSTVGLSHVRFFHDANGNSRLDPGEDDRAFLNLAPDEATDLSTLIVLATGGGGVSYLAVEAEVGDGEAAHSQESVVRVTTRAAPAFTLHLGPADNPKALPGGEGGPDDVSRTSVGWNARSVVFVNDVLNDGRTPDIVRIEPADSSGWPAGITVVIEDSTGTALRTAPDGSAVMLGDLASGEQRRLRVRVTTSDESFQYATDDSLSIRLRVRSTLDTARVNVTTDRIVLAERFDAAAALSIEQTFKENQAAFGDVVTLVVGVANVTDSVRMDGVVVRETPEPSLDFLGGTGFEPGPDGAVWSVGSLEPGERRETVVKFMVNSRVSSGWARVAGEAAGAALGRDVSAGPVVNVIKIDNDIFADEGIVLGDVFIDDNENGKREEGERGMANVGVFLESGEYALTDSAGRFSIPRVFSGYRVVRIDEATLSADLVDKERIPTRTNAVFGTERLVHLVPSGHAVVSFPLAPPTSGETAAGRVARQISCGRTVSVRTRAHAAYWWPSISSSFFETGKAYLKTAMLHELDPILDFLRENPGWMVFLDGHTDSLPMRSRDFASNQELSVARADAVRRYLNAKGASPERIVVRGHGDTRPVATNATPEGRASNRRVDVTLVPPGTSLDEEPTALRFDVDPRRIEAVADTFAVRMAWELSTDSPRPLDVALSVEVPEEFCDASVRVTQGGEEMPSDGGRYRIAGFVRSRSVSCEVNFTSSEKDTHRIRDVRAVVEHSIGALDGASDGETRRATYNPPAFERSSAVVLAPGAARAKNGEADYFPVVKWDEARGPEDGPAGPDARVGASPVEIAGGGASTAEFADATGGAAPADTARSFGILEPADRSIVQSRDRIEVVARVPLGSRYELSAGTTAVPEKQIGKREIRLSERVEEVTWYGVKIESGWNTLRLSARPVDGSAAVEDSVVVALAGRPASIVVSPERVILPAEGRSGATVRVELRDDLGLATINGLLATIAEGDSFLVNVDESPDQRGIQVTSRDGAFLLLVRPSATTGRGRITVETHGLLASCLVTWVPPERRMFLTGVLEGRLGVYRTSGDGDPLGIEGYDDGFRAEGESRFFVQGTAFAGINLTARVDTKKRYDDPLLKTDNPETQYPIYGDASRLSYAAPARSGNYVALEKAQSYVRYGDFRSPLTDGEFLKYKTTTTGLNAAFVSGTNGVAAFVTKTESFTVRDEIPGGGTSGYYYLSQAPVIENSIQLAIEIRDRYQLEKIVESRSLVEHRDFTVNYFNGAVLFKEPVPTYSREMNPVMIVAIYESDSPEEGDYLYGVRGDLAGNRRYRLGASALTKNGDGSDYAVYGANGGVAFGGWDLSGEFARSEDDIVGEGKAYKLQLGTKDFRGEHSVYWRHVDGDFLNPSFTGSAHELFSSKAGFDSRLALARSLSVESHGYRQRFADTGEEKDDIDVVGKYDEPRFMVESGVRVAGQERDGATRDALLSILGARLAAGPLAELRTRWEMNHGDDTVDDYPDRLRSALTVPFRGGHKFVATHEYLSAHGRPATHQLLAGVEARAGRYSTVYSRYAMNRTASDERLGAITGLKQVVPIRPDLSGSLDIEAFRSFSNRIEDEYVALKTGLGKLEKGESAVEGHYEYRWQRAADHHLLRVNAVKEFDDGFAVLFKDALSVSSYEGRKSSLRMEGRVGGAYRPAERRVHALLLLKTQYDKYSPFDPEAIVWTTVVSTDVNYTPAPAHELRFKLAAKRAESYSPGLSETGRNYLVLSQYVYHFAKNWDVDVWGRFLGGAGAGTRQTGAGIEIGRILFDRLRIGAGYSVNGFEDRDLAESEAWERGFGLRVQLILSDWMFSGYEF